MTSLFFFFFVLKRTPRITLNRTFFFFSFDHILPCNLDISPAPVGKKAFRSTPLQILPSTGCFLPVKQPEPRQRHKTNRASRHTLSALCRNAQPPPLTFTLQEIAAGLNCHSCLPPPPRPPSFKRRLGVPSRIRGDRWRRPHRAAPHRAGGKWLPAPSGTVAAVRAGWGGADVGHPPPGLWRHPASAAGRRRRPRV